MAGQYLRTNYRKTGGLVDAASLAPGFMLGSWIGGAGTIKMGPIVMGSYSGVAEIWAASDGGIISIEAGSALASFYGCDKIGDGSGYRIFPFIIRGRVNAGGMSVSTAAGETEILLRASMTDSAGASQMLIWAGGSAYSTCESDYCAHFNWVGLIISAP